MEWNEETARRLEYPRFWNDAERHKADIRAALAEIQWQAQRIAELEAVRLELVAARDAHFTSLQSERVKNGPPDMRSRREMLLEQAALMESCGLRVEAHGIRTVLQDLASAETECEKAEAERDRLRSIVKGVHGALTDSRTVVVPAGIDTADLYEPVMQIVRERDRLREALEMMLDLYETVDQHAYVTCNHGYSHNADRGCRLCSARAALAAQGSASEQKQSTCAILGCYIVGEHTHEATTGLRTADTADGRFLVPSDSPLLRGKRR